MTRAGAMWRRMAVQGIVVAIFAVHVALTLRGSARAVAVPGLDAAPTPPPVQPTIVRDEVSGWTYVSVAVLAAALTVAFMVAAGQVRRRRARSLRSRPTKQSNPLHRRKK